MNENPPSDAERPDGPLPRSHDAWAGFDAIRQTIENNPVSGSPEDMRAAFARIAGTGPTGDVATIAGLRTLRFGDGPPVVWLHGGGYVFGSAGTHASPAAWLAARAGMSVHLPEYRLAPEHVWPAALDDTLAFLETFDAPVALVGDSAGGHLALAAARRVPDRVSALALISPNTDRTGQSRTRTANEDTDAMNSDADDRRLGEMAQPGLPPDDPDVSPLGADLSALPRTFVTASTREVLLDDSLLLIRALGLAGVPVSAEITDAPCHMWTLWPDRLDGGARTLAQIAAFLTGDQSRER